MDWEGAELFLVDFKCGNYVCAFALSAQLFPNTVRNH